MKTATVQQVMTHSLVTVDPELRSDQAEQLAERQGICHLLVMQGDTLVGVACACDLRRAAPDAPVSSCMSWPPKYIDASTSLAAAADVMRRARIGCLPVKSEGKVVGILTRSDLQRHGVDMGLGDGLRCAACGSHHHVRPDPHAGGVPFCLDCHERSAPDAAEIGVVD